MMVVLQGSAHAVDEVQTGDGRGCRAGVRHGARRLAVPSGPVCSSGACAPQRRGILPGWNRSVGLRADPAQLVPRMGCKGAGYLSLSAGDVVTGRPTLMTAASSRPPLAP